jgi:hypothetical protein
VLVVLCAALMTGAAARAAATSSGFAIVSSPAVTYGELNSVSAASASSVWAVGGYSSGAQDRPLVESFTGTAFQRVVLPTALAQFNANLTSVKAISSTNVWAVGGGEFPDPATILAIHWNGTGWQKMNPPFKTGDTAANFTDVDASSASNVWVLGWGTEGVITDRWNGSSWARVPIPAFYTDGTTLDPSGIRVFSPTNVWVSADIGPADGVCPCLSAVLHYNGTKWTLTKLSNAFGTGFTTLAGIAGSAPGNLWPFGHGAAGIDLSDEWLTYHHGPTGGWPAVIPFPGYSTLYPVRDYDLSALVAPSATDVWAAGSWINSNTEVAFFPVVAHYDGSAWSNLTLPQRTTDTLPVGLTTVPGASTIWMVGWDDHGPIVWRRG